MNIVKLFEVVYKYAQDFKRKYPDGDGLAFWRSIKKILSEFDNQTADWSNSISKGKLHKQFYPPVMKLPEKYILGDGTEITDEANHFLIQVFRIPVLDSLTPRKLAQIALNLGQLQPELSADKFSEDFISELQKAELVNPRRFVTLDNLKKLEISEDIVTEVEKILQNYISNPNEFLKI